MWFFPNEMKFNDVELAELSMGEAVLEGRLHHKRTGGNRGLTGKFII